MLNPATRRLLTFFILHSSLFVLIACSGEADLKLGRSLLKEGKFREAITALNRAIEADAGLADAFNSRGVAYFELKEYANAQLDYDQAIKLRPDFYRPYYNRALLQTAKNNLPAALADYSTAIRLAPDTARATTSEIYLNRGQLFAVQDQARAALTDFDHAIDLAPANALALYNRGNLRFQQKDLPGAIADFQRSVAADPQFGKAFYGLGIALLVQNERETACLNLKQAQKLGYADAANAVATYCN
jgi:tetratricopeptide (TPR) repeat protein